MPSPPLCLHRVEVYAPSSPNSHNESILGWEVIVHRYELEESLGDFGGSLSDSIVLTLLL
jgi:hypothetical protein